MQNASTAYKTAMKQPLRNRSYLRVSIGVINQKAQASAQVENAEECTYWSNLKKPLENDTVDLLYATAEQDYSKTDGNMYFLPRSPDDVVLNAGIVSAELLGAVRVSFDTAYDIKGMMIEFGKSFPTDFTIESDNNTVSISGNGSGSFRTEEIFMQSTYILITPTTMSNGNGRLHVNQITMGIGIFFTNKDIKSSSLKDTVSPISEDLPAIDFSLTVDNTKGVYDTSNDESLINFLETEQECIVEYGYELNDGTIEWISGAKVYMKSWSADDTQMQTSYVDRFAYMQDTYYKGKYYSDGISLFALAVDVLTDAGLEESDYWIDPYLETIIVYNPIPVCMHKEALQIIANAGRCILSQDQEAKIYLKSSFLPDMVASSDNEAYFSNVANVLISGSKDIYATANKSFSVTNGTQFFLPRPDSEKVLLNTGYVSDVTSDEDGLFEDNPKIAITLETAFKFYNLALQFGGIPPEELIIHTFLNEAAVEDLTISEILTETVISHEFIDFNKMIIEITKGSAYNRAIVNLIEFGEVTDYTLEKALDLTDNPTGTKLEKVKAIQLTRTMYNQAGTLQELLNEKVTASDTEYEFIFEFSNASYGYVCSLSDPGAGQSISILESGAFYIRVSLNGFTEETEVTISISGYEYVISSAKTVISLNSSGEVKTWGNPLISTVIQAKEVGEWMGEYLSADKEYGIPYRGDPRIDANDILYMENDYIDDLQVRVLEHSVSFGGTLSGSIKARRIM